MPEVLHVEVVYAAPDRVLRRQLELPAAATLGDAVRASGLLASLPGAFDPDHDVGVFGRRLPPSHPLRDGDRVELYRTLQIDPMEARRRRAGRT
jgi:uncharacterized protein